MQMHARFGNVALHINVDNVVKRALKHVFVFTWTMSEKQPALRMPQLADDITSATS